MRLLSNTVSTSRWSDRCSTIAPMRSWRLHEAAEADGQRDLRDSDQFGSSENSKPVDGDKQLSSLEYFALGGRCTRNARSGRADLDSAAPKTTPCCRSLQTRRTQAQRWHSENWMQEGRRVPVELRVLPHEVAGPTYREKRLCLISSAALQDIPDGSAPQEILCAAVFQLSGTKGCRAAARVSRPRRPPEASPCRAPNRLTRSL